MHAQGCREGGDRGEHTVPALLILLKKPAMAAALCRGRLAGVSWEGYPCKVCYGLFALFLDDPCLAQPKLTGG